MSVCGVAAPTPPGPAFIEPRLLGFLFAYVEALVNARSIPMIRG